jgi:ketosteroid isomerase-like protein
MRTAAPTIAIVALLALPAVPVLADDMADLKAARAALEIAFVNQDADAILSLMTPDHIAVTPSFGGVLGREAQAEAMADLKVTFHDVSEPRITMLAGEGAYVTYEETLKGSFRGKPLPDRVFASELWVKSDGKWLEKAYQETVIESP